jgi:hypothetical protein
MGNMYAAEGRAILEVTGAVAVFNTIAGTVKNASGPYQPSWAGLSPKAVTAGAAVAGRALVGAGRAARVAEFFTAAGEAIAGAASSSVIGTSMLGVAVAISAVNAVHCAW